MKLFDAVVIGAGAGGLTALDELLGAGKRVAIVERHKPGGDCNYWGCVPTKTLLRSAKVAHLARRARDYGIEVGDVRVDFAAVQRRKRAVVDDVSGGGKWDHFWQRGATVYQDSARFVGERTVRVGDETITGDAVVIATGSVPAKPPIPGLDRPEVITNVEAVDLPAVPQRLVVIGGGPIGIEFAQLYHRLGSRVVVLEVFGHILPKEDEEVARRLQAYLEGEGIEIHCVAKVQRVEGRDGRACVVADCGGAVEEFPADTVLVATGRRAMTAELDPAKAGVRTDERGWVVVDEYLRTSAPQVWAVGDCVGGLMFTHMADYMGRIAGHNILHPEAPRAVDYRVTPWATFTDPALGRVGLTEAEAVQAGHDVVVGRLEWGDLERAKMEGETKGLVKIVAERATKKILGASVLAPSGDDLVAEVALAMRAGLTADDVFWTIHAYPTFSEAIRWSAGRAAGR